jgi:hypothetical protein
VAPDPRDRPEHARLIARPERRTAVERANDQALEYLILFARSLAVLMGLCALLTVGLFVWVLDWRFAVGAALEALVAGGAGWWGWWVKGNEEWRRGNSV